MRKATHLCATIADGQGIKQGIKFSNCDDGEESASRPYGGGTGGGNLTPPRTPQMIELAGSAIYFAFAAVIALLVLRAVWKGV